MGSCFSKSKNGTTKANNNNGISNNNNNNNKNNSNSSNNNTKSNSLQTSNTVPVSASNGKKSVKVLLLGSGDTGKSTCFKQMSLIHNEGFDEKIINEYKFAVRANALRGMKALIDACKEFEYPIDERLVAAAEELDGFDDDVYMRMQTVWNKRIAKHIKDLWADESIRKAYARNNEFQFIENAKYYFENIDRIAEDDYRPTPFDILSTRTKTVGVVEKTININEQLEFKLIDVGGQRNERRKWFTLFEGVGLVIFLVACSDFNKLCYEDDETNRMIENFNLYKETVNNKFFKDTPFVILFNKMDVFKEKLKLGQKITSAFPDYDGSNDPDECIEFIKEKYKEARNTFAPVHCFETMATDTEELAKVFNDIKKIISDMTEGKSS
jgi:signal recognition particle receptor subunit beta